MLTNNHEHHFLYMSTVLQLGRHEMMVKGMIWAYRAYHSRGVSYDYFLWEPAYWQEAISALLKSAASEEINQIYRWIASRHNLYVAAAKNDPKPMLTTPLQYFKTKTIFLQHLLKGDRKACLKIAKESITCKEDTKDFYLHVIQPSLYDAGMGWETGRTWSPISWR